jgi:hypothetical protein
MRPADACRGIDHDEELHDARIHRRCHRLDQKDVPGADVLFELNEDILVGEFKDLGVTQRHLEVVADSTSECGVRIAGEDLEVLVERCVCHDGSLCHYIRWGCRWQQRGGTGWRRDPPERVARHADCASNALALASMRASNLVVVFQLRIVMF